jgi:hypothetical protein
MGPLGGHGKTVAYNGHGDQIEGRAGADQDFTLSSVERRTIGYFE